MPPLPVIADVYRVTWNWHTADGTTPVNVTHFSAPGKTRTQLFLIILSHASPGMWGAQCSSDNVLSLSILPLDGSGATSDLVISDITNFRGAKSGEAIPAVCNIIKLQTGLRGPRHRGRLFLPNVAEGAQNGGLLSGVIAGLVTAAWVTFALMVAGDGAAIGVASYRHADWNQAIALSCEEACGTQRRRQQQIRRSH